MPYSPIEQTIVIAKLLKEYNDELMDRLSGVYVRSGDRDDTYILELIHKNEDDIRKLFDGKVDKIPGMGLSANNFTDALRDKLESIDLSGTHVTDWNAGPADEGYIKNKPKTFYDDSYVLGLIDTINAGPDEPGSILYFIANAEHVMKEFVTALPSVADADENTIYILEKTDSKGAKQYEPYFLKDGSFVSLWQTIQSIYDSADLRYAQIEYVTALPSITDAKERILYVLQKADSIGNYSYIPYLKLDIGGTFELVPLLRTMQEIYDSADSRYERSSIVTALPSVSTAKANTIYFLKKLNSDGVTYSYIPHQLLDGAIVPFGGTGSANIKIVSTLPTYASADKDAIYVLKELDTTTGNYTYKEYVVDTAESKLVEISGSSTYTPKKYTTTIIGDDTTLNFVINHALDTTDVDVTIKDIDNDICWLDYDITDADNITLKFDTPPTTTDTYTVIVKA